jgi:phosphoacetylglucosamine mutase
MYVYGTSGFRFHHTVVEEIAEKIGYVVAHLSASKSSPYGIMITASHNPHEDNGVKIINETGEMIGCMEEKIVTDYINDCTFFPPIMERGEIYVGFDTRASGENILKLIQDGACHYNPDIKVRIIGCVTTPELHFCLWKHHNNALKSYGETLKSLNMSLKNTPMVCDCANGVGALTLEKLSLPNITLINHDYTNHELLNKNSGSDYVISERCNSATNDALCFSLDGDADRMVCSYRHNGSFHLLDGDKICALIAYYISTKISNLDGVAVIHTGYSNNAFVEFIRALNITTVCAATGVKNLHREALKYDISIYFESNGHGTVIFNKLSEELNELRAYFHPSIGDGIMNMFAVVYILQQLNMTPEQWVGFYETHPSELFKLRVPDKSLFITSGNEMQLDEPRTCQLFINQLCEKYDCKAFVRPSGTEDYIRVYIESRLVQNVRIVRESIEEYIQYNYKYEAFEKNNVRLEIGHLSTYDYESNYLYLLKQLTTIEPENISKCDFDRFVKSLDKNHIVLVIRDQETKMVVGSITVLIEQKLIHDLGKVAHIEDVVVDESMRGYGLGKVLLTQAEKVCVGCYKVILDCSDQNVPFYEKCGYERKGNEMARYMH